MTPISLFHLRCGRLEAEITNLGGRLVRLLFEGIDVVQGFDHADDYLPDRHASDFGAIIGRYANRIAGGRLRVGERVYQLPINNGPNCLHGGPMGWQYALFEAQQVDEGHLRLRHTSPDGDQGFPAEVRATIDYRLLPDATLRIDYHAEADGETAVNLTNHSYFNLSGDLSSSILDHQLCIHADRYTPTDVTNIPLGEHVAVEGSPFDFRQPKAIGRDIEMAHQQLEVGHGYDHNFVLSHPTLEHPAATLFCPRSGIMMEVATDSPGVQLYTGNFLDGVVGKQGQRYGHRSAVCLETQQYPDSPSHRWAESPGRIDPEHPLRTATTFTFSRKEACGGK